MAAAGAPFSTLRLQARHAVFIALVVGPLAGLQTYNLWSERGQKIERVRAAEDRFLQIAIERYRDTVDDAKSTLDLLSQIPAVADQESASACNAQLSRILPTRFWATSLHLVDGTGHVSCSTFDIVRGMDVTDRAWYKETKAAGHFLVSDVFLNRARQAPSIMAAVPLGANAMLAATIDTSWLATLSRQVGAGERFEILIVDGKGVVAARFPNEGPSIGQALGEHPLVRAALAETAGTFRGPGLNGEERLVAFKRLPYTTLTLVVGLETQDVLAPIDQSTAVSLALFALVTAFGGFLVWLFGTWFFVHPFRLAETALAQSETRYRQLAEQSSDLILLIGSKTERVYISPAVETMLGYSVEVARRMSMRDLIHADDIGTVLRQFRSLSPDHSRCSATYRIRHKNGHYLWAEAAFCYLEQSGGQHETIVTIRNITERQREAEQLRMASQAALQAQASADEANQAKTEFLACMSHEIRTPLNAIIGFTALLLDSPSLQSEARHYGERIQNGGQALLTIVNDILDFSEVEEGRVEIKREAFALPLLIDECLSMVQQAAVAKRLLLDVTLLDRLPPGVLGDEHRLRQVLLNLLNNAIKFTSEGSVLLEVRYEEPSASKARLRFSIVDTGKGIAEADLPRLFKRFRQIDGTNRRTHGGTGLGLAICKRLVALMGGAIGVSSMRGVGSTFWFALDLPAAPLVLRSDRAKPGLPKRGLHLLLAEDVALNQELACLILRAGGHTVDVVANGAEAIMAVHTLPYDAVLMDLQMPYVDGLTATRAIRGSNDPCRSIPIIALTANVLPEQMRQARDAGMDDAIQKPFTAEQLYRTLEAIGGRASTMPIAGAEAHDVGKADRFDAQIVSKLVGLIGDTKVKALLRALAESIRTRFDGETTEEGRAAWRREAHSSVAGSSMLGFVAFSAQCKTLEATAQPAAFDACLVRLKSERDEVVALATDLSSRETPLLDIFRSERWRAVGR